MKKILVTSGGTQEYIDDFRVLTNVSTGKLGCLTAMNLSDTGAKIFYVCSKSSEKPDSTWLPKNNGKIETVVIKSVSEAVDAIKKIMTEEKIDAVVHAMAVSDFTFKKDKDIKCKSTDPEAFIEYMRQTITVNPKIISMMKQWCPEAILIGFKFEIGLTKEELAALAAASIERNECDLVIANDKAEMKKLQRHAAHFFYSNKMKEKGLVDEDAYDKSDISNKILDFLTKVL